MKTEEKVKVYMCKVDYDHHIPDDRNGVEIYFSIKDLKRNRKCVERCGIIECELVFSKIVEQGDF